MYLFYQESPIDIKNLLFKGGLAEQGSKKYKYKTPLQKHVVAELAAKICNLDLKAHN